MSYEFITEEKKGRVGLITLNRPKQLNALNARLMQELGQALHAFDADPGIGAYNYRVCNRDRFFVYSSCNTGFWNGAGWLDSAVAPSGGWTHQLGGAALLQTLFTNVKTSLTSGLHLIFVCSAIIMVLAIPLHLLLRSEPLRTRVVEPELAAP